jgi:hypothetical protein
MENLINLADYKATTIEANFEQNTITFLIDGDFSVEKNEYYIFSKENLNKFIHELTKRIIENSDVHIRTLEKIVESKDELLKETLIALMK